MDLGAVLLIACAAAQEPVVSVSTKHTVVPCLAGQAQNSVAAVQIDVPRGADGLALTELRINLTGTTDLADIAAVEILGRGGERLGSVQEAAEELVFRGSMPLAAGTNTLQISVSLVPTADLDHFVDAGCDRAILSDGTEWIPEPRDPAGALRIGLALRTAGDDGAAVYRIPALTTTREGTLIAVYDVRWQGWKDLPGHVDVGLSRSVDGGRNWEPMQVILDMGDDPAHEYDGVGDPAVLVDQETGTIWVAATWSHGDRAWRGSGPGLTPAETGQLLLIKSDDDGRTWCEPINITEQVKRPEWCYLLQGPGRGICMRDGTLVFAAQYQDTPENHRTPHSTLLYSRDHGQSWHLGTGVKPDTTEAQVVELEEGLLMLNVRDNHGGSRSVFTTRDLGQRWQEHPSSRSALVDPICNAALLSTGSGALLFCNPAVPEPPRRNMTLKASTDAGLTWPEAHQWLLDEGQSAGYSSLSMIDGETVGILFEGSRAQLSFLRVDLGTLVRR